MNKKNKSRFISLLLIASMLLSISPSTPIQSKGSSVKSVTWSKSKHDPAMNSKPVKLKVRINDKNLIASVYVTIESSKHDIRTLYLSLESGSNKAGTWASDVYFDKSQTGTWRVTQIVVSSYGRYQFTQRKPKGIGKKIKICSGATSNLTLTTPKQKLPGESINLKAVLKSKKKAMKKTVVQYYLSYYDKSGKLQSKTYRVKTNKKGVATKKFKMPSNSLYVSVSYKGKSFKSQPCYSSSSIQRKWLQAKLSDLKMTWNEVCGSKASTSVVLKQNNGAVLANKKVVFVIDRKTYPAKTNAKGIASASIPVNGNQSMYAYLEDSTHTATSIYLNIPKPKATFSNLNYIWDSTYGSNATVSVYLKNNKGIALANQTVIFELNWESYTATTNAAGLAKITMPFDTDGDDLLYAYLDNENYQAASINTRIPPTT